MSLILKIIELFRRKKKIVTQPDKYYCPFCNTHVGLSFKKFHLLTAKHENNLRKAQRKKQDLMVKIGVSEAIQAKIKHQQSKNKDIYKKIEMSKEIKNKIAIGQG